MKADKKYVLTMQPDLIKEDEIKDEDEEEKKPDKHPDTSLDKEASYHESDVSIEQVDA